MINPNVYYQIFPQLFNMSITATVIILGVLLVRLLLRKVPKLFSYALWSVVLFRLLCPVSFSMEFSILSLLDAPTTEGGSIEYVPSNIVHMENPSVDIPIPGVSEIINDSLPRGEEQLVADPLEFPVALATNIWVFGVAVLIFYSVAELVMLRRRLVGAVPLQKNIYLTDHIDTPFTIGLFQPKIYLPSTLPAEERDYIILHEQHHIRRGDHIIKILAFAALCIHWFNPLVWLAFILSGKDMEMSCDEAVMKKVSEDIRADYSASLLRFATGRRIIVGTPLAFGAGDTKDRVKNVMRYKKPTFWVVTAAVVMCVVPAVCLLANPGEEKPIDGSRYRVAEIVYDAPEYSFVHTLDNVPQYIISDDWILLERPIGGVFQESGRLQKVDYSRTERYELFEPLTNNVHELLDRVKTSYRADIREGDINIFYLVMQTRRGEVLLAEGFGEGPEGKVRWLYRLEREDEALNIEEMEAEIEDMSGQTGTIFSIYESDTMPGWLLVGYEEANGDGLGFARFKYLESTNRYVTRGYSSFSGESLYSMTIAREQEWDHSVTIALSRREDLAEVTAEVGEQFIRKGVSGCPTMVVFEWPEILPEGEDHVEVKFYNVLSEELER